MNTNADWLTLAKIGNVTSTSEDDEDTSDVDQCNPSFYGTNGTRRGTLPLLVERSTDLDPETVLLAREALKISLATAIAARELGVSYETMGIDIETQDMLEEIVALHENEQDYSVGPVNVGVRVTRNPEFSSHRPNRSVVRPKRSASKGVLVEVNFGTRRNTHSTPTAPSAVQHPHSAPAPTKIGTHGKTRPHYSDVAGAFGKNRS